jgi:cell division protein ZapA
MSTNDKKSKSAQASVPVTIYDQPYQLRGPDEEYIRELARTVDAKMRIVAAQGKTVDSLRVAVLAALNIADELRQLQLRLEKSVNSETAVAKATPAASQQSLHLKAESLNSLLDEILDDRKLG